MKKLLAVILVLLLTMSMVGCGTKEEAATGGADVTKAASDSEEANNKEKVTIGIGQFAEHKSLDNCKNGFLEGLKEAGYVEGDNLEVLFENAQADTGLAAQIANDFMAKKAQLICAIATPMAQSAYAAAKDAGTPVIFTAVTDPVLAELAKEDKTPSGEITGTSDKLAVKEQLEMIHTILPEAKKIGIMYSTSEVNSVSAIEEYKKLAPDYGFEIVESGISTASDIPLAADNLLSKVDCITNLTDNTVVSSLPVILEKAADKNIPVFGSEVEQVKIGCLAAMGIDYFELGKQTGAMAAKVLKGEKKASEINFETISEYSFYGNTAVADNLGVTLPNDMVSSAKEMFSAITE